MAAYLVTGGAGFIGSNLTEVLVKKGHYVRVVDNLSTGSFENIRGVINKIDFICGDLADFKVAQKAVDGIDYILHQAAIPSVPRSIDDPSATNRSIVTAAVNLFKAAVDCKTVKRIVQASSSSIYGNTAKLPKTEDMQPNPLSPYAAAKLSQEQFANAFYNTYGLEILSLRYFNVFGPRQNPHSLYSSVIPKFLSLMIKGERPVIYGDGYTSRDFTYVDNVIEANLLASKCQWTGKPEVINVGCGESITLNELVCIINVILESDITPVYEQRRMGDVKESLADITKAQMILGYEVKTDFFEGIKKLAALYKKALESQAL